MFERYTELARRAVFFARFEASNFGSQVIETEHLLLGIFRELSDVVLPVAKRERIRHQLEEQLPRGQQTATSVDLPLSHSCRRVLAFAAQEVESAHEKNLDVKHLLIGILREESSLAAKLLVEGGITIDALKQLAVSPRPLAAPPRARSVEEPVRDLVTEARARTLWPVIGREPEIEMAIRILSRRTKNSVALVGEAGVGKTSIVYAIAQRIAEDLVPEFLSGRRIVEGGAANPDAIVFWRGHFAAKMADDAQYIATGTPQRFREADERITSRFEVVYVAPASEEETAHILDGVKAQYESFHAVQIEDVALDAAVTASRRFMPYRSLPERAIDLIDDACARVKLREEAVSSEVRELNAQIRRIVRKMENAIATHQFDEARRWSDQERQERQKLLAMREQKPSSAEKVVRREDVEQAVAERAGVPVSAVQRVLAEKEAAPLETLTKVFAASLPVEHRDWAAALAAHVLACSADDAQRLANTILSVKK